ncbi:MAG: VWA domain-containing protein [Terracidiphilus sp.]|jgi:VWFA-related protein
MRSTLCTLLIAVAGILILGAGTAALSRAQASSASQAVSAPAPAVVPDTGETVFRANSNLVLVDVVVADRGKPIHGLDRGRFHLFEDGREQTVTAFDEHQFTGQAQASPHIVKLPPNTFSNDPVYPDNGVVNILLLDGLNTPLINQMDVRRTMIDYMGKIQPGTPLAIFTLASRLRLVAGFTTDAALLVKALKETKAGPQQAVGGMSPTTETSTSQLIADLGVMAPSSFNVASLQQFTADFAAFQTDARVTITLNALQELARYLSAIPGRKNLIWFSGSFPISLDPDPKLKRPIDAVRDYTDDVRRTAELLSAARVAVYPVDARGLISPLFAQASTNTFGGPDSTGIGVVAKSNAAEDEKMNEHSSMQQIAEQTGGQEYVNTNALAAAVASAVEHGSDYYTVGYVPGADKLDGKFHKLQVKVEGVSYKLAYRRGYFADTPGKSSEPDPVKQSMMAAAAMHGEPPATQILFQSLVVQADDPQIKGVKLPDGPAGAMAATLKGPVIRYVVDMRIDPKGVLFEKTPEGMEMAAVELALIAYDGDGKRVNYFDKSVTLNLKPEQYARVMAGKIPAIVPLDLPAGNLSLRMVILDRAAGRTGSLEVPVTVGAVKAGD